MRRRGDRQRQDVGAGPGGEDYFQIGWWLESGERVNQDLREQSWSSENEALLHKNRNIFMLSAIFNFKPVCNYAEPDVPRLNSGWNLIVTDPAWARGPLCHGPGPVVREVRCYNLKMLPWPKLPGQLQVRVSVPRERKGRDRSSQIAALTSHVSWKAFTIVVVYFQSSFVKNYEKCFYAGSTLEAEKS